MTFASRYRNATNLFNFKADDDSPYLKAADLDSETTYTIRAVFINRRGRFGPTAVVVCDDFLLNAPSHVLNDVERMLSDDAAITAINDGKAGFRPYEFKNKYGVQHGIEWTDVE